MQWFKIHHGFSTDPKLGVIAHQLSIPRAIVNAIVIDLIEHASKADARGNIARYDEEAAAFNLGIDHNALRNVMGALRNRRFVTDNAITNWHQYQGSSDPTNAKRQKRWRDKHKQEHSSAVTDRNALRNTDKIREEEKREDSSSCAGGFEKVFDAGIALFPNLAAASTASIQQWLNAGCCPDKDILPELKRQSGRSPRSWGYFTNSIMDAKVTREKPPPPGNPRSIKPKEQRANMITL